MDEKPNYSPQLGLLSLQEAASYDLLVHCMRCGLCLSVCPTYSIYGLETASPRGRLALMRAVSETRLELGSGFNDAMSLCLGCLACQTACPAGVEYGHLLEKAQQQAELRQKKERSPWKNRLRLLLLNGLLRGPHGLESIMPLLRLYQRLGLQQVNLGRLLPDPVGFWERMLPKLNERSAHQVLGERLPAIPPLRGRVGLLTGCLENTLLANMCVATARVLALNGFEVIIPPDQECCGALPAHIGDLDLACQRARKNIDVFESVGVDFVISDAAGCSAQLKEYPHLLINDPQYQKKACLFAQKVRDATEFLCENGSLRTGMKPLNLRVAYDDPCHLIHAQGISLQPRQLLREIPGVELVELPESDWCCGSAGTYNLTHLPESMALLERKMEYLKKIKPDVLATANTGCYIQLAAGVKEYGLSIKVMHVVELIDQAYQK